METRTTQNAEGVGLWRGEKEQGSNIRGLWGFCRLLHLNGRALSLVWTLLGWRQGEGKAGDESQSSDWMECGCSIKTEPWQRGRGCIQRRTGDGLLLLEQRSQMKVRKRNQGDSCRSYLVTLPLQLLRGSKGVLCTNVIWKKITVATWLP